MYCMDNMVMVSHEDLFIHLDLGFLGSFHDAMILRHSSFYMHWCAHCIHSDGYFDILLEEPSCIGKDMFICKDLAMCKGLPDMDEGALTAQNRLHVGYLVRVEWGHWCIKAQILKTHEVV